MKTRTIVFLAIWGSILLNACQMTNLYDARPLQKGEKSLTLGTDSQVVDPSDPQTSFTNKLLPHLAIYPALEYSWGRRYNTNYSVSLSTSDGLSFGAKSGWQ